MMRDSKQIQITFRCLECGASGYVHGDEWIEISRCPNTREIDRGKHTDPSKVETTREGAPLHADVTLSEPQKPPGYDNDLGSYGPQLFDGWCGEPIGWGFKIVRRLGEQRFNDLAKYGTLECIPGTASTWFLITKTLTREEAEQKYGPLSAEDFGPRGGWRSVTFSDKKFVSKYMRKVR